MKNKILAMLLCGALLVGVAACGNANTGAGSQTDTAGESTSAEDSNAADETGEDVAASDTETDAEQQPEETIGVSDAEELLTKVWNAYDESELFPIGGGDYDHTVTDAPGKYDVTKTDDMDAVLGLPKASADMIDDAASIVHMMNANTFTAGAFHLTDAAKQQTLADALKDNIVGRQWVCGFPDTLIVASVGNEYIVSAFGNADNIEIFKTKLQEIYPTAKLLYEESLL